MGSHRHESDESRRRRTPPVATTGVQGLHPTGHRRLRTTIAEVITELVDHSRGRWHVRRGHRHRAGGTRFRSSARCSARPARIGSCSRTGPMTSSRRSAGAAAEDADHPARRGMRSTPTSTTWSPPTQVAHRRPALRVDPRRRRRRPPDSRRTAHAGLGHADGGHRHHPKPGGGLGPRAMRSPRAVALLAEHPELAAKAVEETMRHSPIPFAHVPHLATRTSNSPGD